MCPEGSQLTYLVWPALESHFQKWVCSHNHTLGKCITKTSWLCPPSHRGHTYFPGALNAGNLGGLTLTFFLGWVIWQLERDSLMAVAASAPLLPSTSIFLITAINKQPLATSPAQGRGEAEPWQHLVKNLSPTLAGWVCMFLKVLAAAGISHLSCPPERKAPLSWGHLRKCLQCFTLPERVGARTFSLSHAGAHAKNMLRWDSESPHPPWGWARLLVSNAWLIPASTVAILTSVRLLSVKGCQESQASQQITVLGPFPEMQGWNPACSLPGNVDYPLSCFQLVGPQVPCMTARSMLLGAPTYKLLIDFNRWVYCFSDKTGSSREQEPHLTLLLFLVCFFLNHIWPLACWWYSVITYWGELSFTVHNYWDKKASLGRG